MYPCGPPDPEIPLEIEIAAAESGANAPSPNRGGKV